MDCVREERVFVGIGVGGNVSELIGVCLACATICGPGGERNGEVDEVVN